MKTASVILVIMFACSGCATFGGGRITSSSAWQQRGGSAGKVLLLVSGSPSEKTNADEITRAAVAAINHQPNSKVINADEVAQHWNPEITDGQALEMAKSRGADTVCMISVAEYASWFTISIDPVVWRTGERTMFSFKLIDAPTGSLLAHSDTDKTVTYPFGVTPPNVPRAFQERVQWAMKPVPAY
jgi:hypothetical protein